MCSRLATSCINCGRPLNWAVSGSRGVFPFLVAGVLFIVGLVAAGMVLIWLLGYVNL